MHCPFCQHDDTRVIDSRVSEDGATIRRRRECPACGERFNTFETAEIKLPSRDQERRSARDVRRAEAARGFRARAAEASGQQRAGRRGGARGRRGTAPQRRARSAVDARRRAGHARIEEARPGRVRALRLGLSQLRGRAGVPRGDRAPRARPAGDRRPAAAAARRGRPRKVKG